MVRDSSLCGLGKTAPNPVLTTFLFRDEYLDHVVHKVCPAHICQAMKEYRIDPKSAVLVPSGASLSGILHFWPSSVPYVIDQEKCTKCGLFEACPFDSIIVEWRKKEDE